MVLAYIFLITIFTTIFYLIFNGISINEGPNIINEFLMEIVRFILINGATYFWKGLACLFLFSLLFVGITLIQLFIENIFSNKRKLEKDKEDIRLNNLTNIQFGTDSNDILEVMNQLVSIVSNNSDLKTKKIVVQKLEYGLMKLNQFGLTNEVEYFTEKLNKIKPKWWEYVIHVLNSK